MKGLGDGFPLNCESRLKQPSKEGHQFLQYDKIRIIIPHVKYIYVNTYMLASVGYKFNSPPSQTVSTTQLCVTNSDFIVKHIQE